MPDSTPTGNTTVSPNDHLTLDDYLTEAIAARLRFAETEPYGDLRMNANRAGLLAAGVVLDVVREARLDARVKGQAEGRQEGLRQAATMVYDAGMRATSTDPATLAAIRGFAVGIAAACRISAKLVESPESTQEGTS